MRVGIIAVHVDYNRRGAHHRGPLQPHAGPLIAALLPDRVDVDVVNDAWEDPDWSRAYDLVFLSCLHPDFDRARQISHYCRRRGARTVLGGPFASQYPHLCAPFFDAVCVGDAEGLVRRIHSDFERGRLAPLYVSPPYDPSALPVPRFDLAASNQLFPLSLEATRGCPFACEFCSLSGLGTRFHTRPPELVLRDLREGQRMLRGLVPAYKRMTAIFVDNNIGGNPAYLATLCDALQPTRIRWGASITFNCLQRDELVERMARAGCRLLFVGLETFAPDTLASMHKYQNSIDETRRVLERSRAAGILVVSGLVISPQTDDAAYMDTIPDRLAECGLHVPSFISIECPFPGTPLFRRLADRERAFLPGAMLRDFTGYALVTKPERETVGDFLAAYRSVLSRTFTLRAKLRKLTADVPRLLMSGSWEAAAVNAAHQCSYVYRRPHPDRTYLTGTDVEPPEVRSVPFNADDFVSEEEYRSIMEPWRVADQNGSVLPHWRTPVAVFERGGGVVPNEAVLRAEVAARSGAAFG